MSSLRSLNVGDQCVFRYRGGPVTVRVTAIGDDWIDVAPHGFSVSARCSLESGVALYESVDDRLFTTLGWAEHQRGSE